jgi:hypothetical protein
MTAPSGFVSMISLNRLRLCFWFGAIARLVAIWLVAIWRVAGRRASGVLILTLLLIWLVGLTNLGLAAPALASDLPSAAPVNDLDPATGLALPTRLDADDISAEKIHQFVQAYLQVLALIEGRETELQGAEMEFESQQIQREIEAQAVALIQSAGLTLQEYLQLLSFTNIDPEFGERVAAQLQEATQ